MSRVFVSVGGVASSLISVKRAHVVVVVAAAAAYSLLLKLCVLERESVRERERGGVIADVKIVFDRIEFSSFFLFASILSLSFSLLPPKK